MKLACTIADLAGSGDIQSPHLAEALHTLQLPEDQDGVFRFDLLVRWVCRRA